MSTTPFNVAISRNFSRGTFLAESPANILRGLETTPVLAAAKRDFTDQASVHDYAVARGGVSGDWLVLDLYAAGVR